MVYFLVMPFNKEEVTHNSHERYLIPEGKPTEIYAGGKIKVFGGHSPETIIYITELHRKIIIHKFGPFEFNRRGEIDYIAVQYHHDSKFVIGFNEVGSYEYDVCSPDGIIGHASGKRLDLLFGLSFYTDPKINHLIKDAKIDENVLEYLDLSVVSAGKHRHNI